MKVEMKNPLLLLFTALLLIQCSKKDGISSPDILPPDNAISIISFDPIAGFCREELTIKGQNFSTTLSDNEVTINGIPSEVIQASADEIKIIVPNTATTGKIKIVVGTEEAESAASFEVLVADAPIITRLSAGGGMPQDIITISGEHFSDNLDDLKVQFGEVLAEIVENSTTSLTVSVPESETAKISVTVKGQTVETSSDFIYFTIDMDQVLEDFMVNNPNVPSIVMTVVKDGAVFYSHSVGYYNQQNTKLADQSTLYNGSSITKMVLAIAIMQQVEQGNLDLDNDINDYLSFEVRNPNFPNEIITPRMLMQHASSLANPFPGEATNAILNLFPPNELINLHPMIEDVITPGSSVYNPLIWQDVAPGTLHKNSNYGLTILGYLVEQLSGQHYVHYTREHVFEPLGMDATSLFYPYLDPDKIAVLYRNNGQPFEPFNYWFYPVGMLYTSGEDWSRFMIAMLNSGNFNGNQILQSSSVDAILDVITPSNNQLVFDSNIGLIWREAPINEGWYGHTGGGGGVTHITEINPVTNVGYTVFTNRVGLNTTVVPGGTLNNVIHQWLLEIE